MIKETLVLFERIRKKNYTGNFNEYIQCGGYQAIQKVVEEFTPQEVIEIVKKSGLRGRGGAGFPTGLKWSFMAKNTGKPNYLIINADEGEPGTFKDREIMVKDPHLLLEGIMIGSYAINCKCSYIYIRGEYYEAISTINNALMDLKKEKLLGENNKLGKNFDLDIVVHSGAGSYICGEETALLDSLEGKRGEPRVKPPFPAVAGFNGCPTSVNNVETIANLPVIINRGTEFFLNNGTPNNAGTRIVCVSGNVKKPGNYEIKMGENLKSIIEELAGGVDDGRTIKGVIPGGSSVPILTPNEIDIAYDFETLAKAGTFMGSCGIIVLDDRVDIVKLLYRITVFYNRESCGQCTPCREGVQWLKVMLRDLIRGKGNKMLIDNIYRVASNIMSSTLCALGDAAAMPVISYLTKYRSEFETYMRKIA